MCVSSGVDSALIACEKGNKQGGPGKVALPSSPQMLPALTNQFCVAHIRLFFMRVAFAISSSKSKSGGTFLPKIGKRAQSRECY